jgi:PIN domain nuclease of toxin-antitoxin system
MLEGVTDTHALVWFATNQLNKIGDSARRIFTAASRQDGSGIVTVPTTVLHEISCLLIANKVRLRLDFSRWVAGLGKDRYFRIVDVTAEMVVSSHAFRSINDPFDRLIMGCSAQMDQPLLTGDQRITDSKAVQVIWD